MQSKRKCYKEVKSTSFKLFELDNNAVILIRKEDLEDGANFNVYYYDNSLIEELEDRCMAINDNYNYLECVYCEDKNTSFEDILEDLDINEEFFAERGLKIPCSYYQDNN